ncbi:MAG: hypothetical protein BHV88_06500 [Clostridiales bacterium 41_12_two_minus]|nr:MAG: hypothetical protein BHV88_06500 [Clostridiales bacterium 41_12_two_minus]
MKKSSKSVWSRFVMTLAAAFLLMLVTTVPVKADSSVPLVADMKQTDASTTSAGISWSCPGSEVRFKVEMSEQMSSGYWTYKESQSSASITLTKLGAGKVYYVRITPFKYNIEGWNKYTKVKGTTSRPLRVVTAPDSTPASLTHVKSSTDTIKVKWSAVPGADTYEVEYYIDSSKARKCVTTKTGVTLKKLAKNETYTIYVTAGRRYADGTTTAWSDNDLYKWGIPVKPSKVSGVDVTHYWQNLSEICVENSRIGCADGYQYQLYTAYKDKDSKIKTVTTSSAYTYIKTSALKKHNFYKVKVRAYALNSKNEKMYGGWSSWKYVSPQPDVTKIKNNKSKKGIQISWDKIKGANRYVVYVSTKKDSGYKKFQTTTKTGTVIKKCGKNKLKSGKNYYFYVEPQKKVGNKYVSGLAGNANYCWSLKYKK